MAKDNNKGLRPETLAVAFGYDPEMGMGSVKPPIFMTSTFVYPTAQHAKNVHEAYFDGTGPLVGESNHIYSRLGHPGLDFLEARLAAIDSAEDAVAYCSGMAAHSSIALAHIRTGDSVLHGRPIYGGGDYLYNVMMPQCGSHVTTYVDGTDEDHVRAAAQAAMAKGPLKLIIAETPANPTAAIVDLELMVRIADEVGAKLWVDMAHFAGLVAAGLHPNPVPFADVVSTTVHKTLAGPRSGLILCKEEFAKKIDSAVFPGQQGGPLMHVIAAKAVSFKAAMSEEFKDRQKRTLEGADIIAKRLMQADVVANGVQVLTGSTKVHLVLVDLRNAPINGQETEDLLHEVGITVNRNSVPNDPRPAMVTSGVRIGTPALATRGFGAAEFAEVAEIIAGVLVPNPDIAALRARTTKLTEAFPLYSGLETW